MAYLLLADLGQSAASSPASIYIMTHICINNFADPNIVQSSLGLRRY